MACAPRFAARSLAAVLLIAGAGCHAQPTSSPEPSPDLVITAEAKAPLESILHTRELAIRYSFALTTFDHGSYEEAADLFAQVLLEVPANESGDMLRHLLIQHIGWSLLGAHDLHGHPAPLERGEELLERYLAKHEALLPDAAAEREDIYALLGEYQLRREGEPPPQAHDRLVALVADTQSSFNSQLAGRRSVIDDGPVRVIEVESIPWATPDHPRVQAFFRDPRDLGPSLFDNPGQPMNPTRVLVRGWAKAHSGVRGGKRANALLRAARPELERCYEQALGRGAYLYERVDLELAWDAGALAEVGVDDDHSLDPQASGCVRAALQGADQATQGQSGQAYAELRLTFLVQFESGAPGRQELDYDYFGPPKPLRLEITQTPH